MPALLERTGGLQLAVFSCKSNWFPLAISFYRVGCYDCFDCIKKIIKITIINVLMIECNSSVWQRYRFMFYSRHGVLEISNQLT